MNPEHEQLHRFCRAFVSLFGGDVRHGAGLSRYRRLTVDLGHARAFEHIGDLVPRMRVLAARRSRRKVSNADDYLDP